MNSQALVNAALHDKINNRVAEPQGTANRFQPTEKPRGVVQNPQRPHQEIAGEVSFNPIATVSVQNSSVSVRPVKNTQSRALSTSVVDQSGRVSVRGEKIIDLGSTLHDQIKSKVNPDKLYPKVQESAYVAPHDFTNEKKAGPVEAPSSETKAANQQLKQQLEEINQVLFEQIKQKIAQELQKQRGQINKPTLPIPNLGQKQTNLAEAAPHKPEAPKTETLPNLGTEKQFTPKMATTAPTPSIQTPVLAKPQTAVTQQPKELEKAVPTSASIVVKPAINQAKPPVAPAQPSSDVQEYKNHISKLEAEIESLTKEVTHLDQSLGQLETENRSGELSAIEHKIEVDQLMLKAVAEWRLSLNNLINSHTLALKYLKQKVEWLESKVEQMDSHSHKHEKLHKSPLASTEFPTLSPGFSELDPLTKEFSSPVKRPLEQNDSEKHLAEREHQQVDAEEKATLKAVLKEALAESQAEYQKLESNKATIPNLITGSIKDNPVSQLAPANPAMVAPQQAANLPSQTPTIAVPIKTTQEPDIERQILEAATAEEKLKDDARNKHTEEIKKIALEATQKHLAQGASKAVTPDIEHAVNQAVSSVAPEVIRSEFEKIKAGLTQVDNKNLENLSKEERGEMMHKLATLEKQTVVTKQFDDLKAAAERKRINAELQAMLTRLGEKPTSTPATQEANSVKPEQKIEDLKTQEKQEKTPEQKARIISEIKELERQSQTRKNATLLRPVVKAQPAFGKMLPNTPTVPNVINGIVKDNKGLLLATVVLIVKDKNGDPVRAFKTNKIGQFALSTPVPNGTYILELEKEGYDFDIIEVEVTGAIMQPIEIKAR